MSLLDHAIFNRAKNTFDMHAFGPTATLDMRARLSPQQKSAIVRTHDLALAPFVIDVLPDVLTLAETPLDTVRGLSGLLYTRELPKTPSVREYVIASFARGIYVACWQPIMNPDLINRAIDSVNWLGYPTGKTRTELFTRKNSFQQKPFTCGGMLTAMEALLIFGSNPEITKSLVAKHFELRDQSSDSKYASMLAFLGLW